MSFREFRHIICTNIYLFTEILRFIVKTQKYFENKKEFEKIESRELNKKWLVSIQPRLLKK